MSSVLRGVDERTQLAGANRLELLLFMLGGTQVFGINVFKVQEVVCCPPLNLLPNASPAVCGVAMLRGKTIPVIDLSMAIAGPPMTDHSNGFIIVTEYNQSTQGFLVYKVDKIINLKWEEIKSPPKGAKDGGYLTAVTSYDGKFVEIIDVEKVLVETMGQSDDFSVEIEAAVGDVSDLHVLIADDSSVARNQIVRTMRAIGVQCTTANTGAEALHLLQQWADSNNPLFDKLALVISDIEMPEMDGYALTRRIRDDARLRHLKIVLHSSLTGVFNKNLVKQVGADDFVSKFDAEALARIAKKYLGSSAAE